VKHGLPGGSGGVDALLMQVQVDSEGVELFLELKETLKGSSEAIN